MLSRIFLDSTRRLRTVWRFIIFGLGFVAVELFVGIVIVIGLFFYLGSMGRAEGLFDPITMERLLMEWLVPLTLIVALPNTVLLLGLVVACRKLLDRRSVRSMGMVRPARRWSASVSGGFAVGTAPIVAGVIVLWACGGYHFVGLSCPVLTLLLVPAFILMAFQEEIIFRGYLLQNLLDVRRPIFGVLFTSIFFWLLHSFNPHMWTSPLPAVNLFGAGVILALAYRVSRNIWFPTAMHFGWNLGQGVLFSVPVSGMPIEGFVNLSRNEALPQWLTGGQFGLEGSLLATGTEVGLGILFLWILWYQRRQEARLPTAVIVDVIEPANLPAAHCGAPCAATEDSEIRRSEAQGSGNLTDAG